MQSTAYQLEPFDLGYNINVVDKRPTPTEQRRMFSLRLAAITTRDLDLSRQGRYLIVNTHAGRMTEDEARYDKRLTRGRGAHNRVDDDQSTPLPVGWWTWSEFVTDIVEASGMSQRKLAQRLGIYESSLERYIADRKKKPIEEIRQTLVKAAIEFELIEED